jgi:hypothetical protein
VRGGGGGGGGGRAAPELCCNIWAGDNNGGHKVHAHEPGDEHDEQPRVHGRVHGVLHVEDLEENEQEASDREGYENADEQERNVLPPHVRVDVCEDPEPDGDGHGHGVGARSAAEEHIPRRLRG